MTDEQNGTIKLGDIYDFPGEGFVIELQQDNMTYLFDKQGLLHRIMEKKKSGLNVRAEESALIRIDNYTQTIEVL